MNLLKILNTRSTLYALFIMAWVYEALFANGLGGLMVDFVVWYLGIGYGLIPICHAVINLVKPENTIKIEPLMRVNISIIVGIISGFLFGGFLNLGLILIGAEGY